MFSSVPTCAFTKRVFTKRVFTKNEFAAFGSKYPPTQKNIFVNVFVFTHSKISIVSSQKNGCAASGSKYPSIQKTIFQIL